ncbi:MAG: tRNA pseudouridine(38-40) synthase TruA [Jatrophihabitantaceae bacterium]
MPAGDGGLVRVRLDIAYDGTEFSGWAVQPGRRTVQGELEAALARVLRVPAALTVAGRTDAGVHASGQVAHLDVPQPIWVAIRGSLVRRLSGVLGGDVRVRGVAEVPAEFDARFGALWRRYQYRITERESGADPLRRHQVLSWRRPLDVAAMSAAAAQLVGLHDFVAFCKRRDNRTSIRELQLCRVERTGDGEIVCTAQADAFCHSMVRSLVGALLAVGEGRRPVGWPAGLFGIDRRADEIVVAPAHGLTLVEVGYPPPDQLADRARHTRMPRTLG